MGTITHTFDQCSRRTARAQQDNPGATSNQGGLYPSDMLGDALCEQGCEGKGCSGDEDQDAYPCRGEAKKTKKRAKNRPN